MRDPEKTLPALRAKAQEVLDLAVEAQRRTASGSHDLNSSLMPLMFLAKQMEHMRGVLNLVDGRLYRDAGLVARSMLEGRAQLLWANQKLEDRAQQWLDFWPVSDWRKMNKLIETGRPVKPEVRAFIEQHRSALGTKFVNKTGRKRLEKGQPLRSKDYWDNWTGHSYSRSSWTYVPARLKRANPRITG